MAKMIPVAVGLLLFINIPTILIQGTLLMQEPEIEMSTVSIFFLSMSTDLLRYWRLS